MTIRHSIRQLALEYDLHWSDQKLLEFALDYIEDVAETEGFIRHLRTNTEAAGGTLAVDEGASKMLRTKSRLKQLTPEQQKVVFDPNQIEAGPAELVVVGTSTRPYGQQNIPRNSPADSVVLLRRESEPATVEPEPDTVALIPEDTLKRFLSRLERKK